jgi:hypothetical protein
MGARLVRTRQVTFEHSMAASDSSRGTSERDGSLLSKEGQALGVQVSERGEPKREQPSNKMTREEAERLRALLRSTKAADLNDPLARQRIGRAIAWAIERGPPKLNSHATKKD